MKSIKLFGLAALAALMAMAFVGASSAMAESTALCMEDGSNCIGITHVHETSVGKAKLLSSTLNVECNVLFLGDSVEGSSTPLKISGNFSYSSCGSCTVTEINGPVTIEVLRLGHETGDVTGEGEVHVECFGFIDCVYNGEGLKGTAKGPLLSTQANGEVSLSEQTTTKVKGSLCPATAKLDITTTPLEPTYIVPTSQRNRLCVDVKAKTGEYENAFCLVKPVKPKTGLYEIVSMP